ncbi:MULTISPECIES: DUF2267 domain-containing protein [unclassified Pseudofrankia]|uniref:DUF2267 domain-containing protein n=1 Tax=unclassified Pseudofrankia TaxID=2994372 RepID=UPI0008DAC43E|nr:MULTISPECIES: DUF2267 domain-containing protein [unclassified Pseudofrankia]MDT3442345.1 DUF2267 domain-containing protein [Pseudofrankia sp. BMG5.37]OHV47957.1 hypothetical protein BCD48_16990 [Pseudofrankia sp. BMG5.36]
MKQDQLVSAIRVTGGFESARQAETAMRATLTVLGERISGGETRNLASQLPAAFAEALPPRGGGERFDVQEFYRRVAQLEGDACTEPKARRHARAVVAALKASVSPSEFEDVAGQLPADYADLLSRESVIHY